MRVLLCVLLAACGLVVAAVLGGASPASLLAITTTTATTFTFPAITTAAPTTTFATTTTTPFPPTGGAKTSGGGDDISTAVEAPLGVRVFGARFGVDYWKVFLHQGDILTIDAGSTDGDKVSVCLFPPTVTSSFGLTDAQCLGRAVTNSKQRVKLSIVNPEGYWTIGIADALCSPHNYTTTCASYAVAYGMTLSVRRYTQIINGTPTIGRHNDQLAFAGTVLGASGGYVEVQQVLHKKSTSVSLVPISATGSFAKTLTLPRLAGLYRYRFVYYGDAEHLPTSQSFILRVV
jgi:hypothetical protein